MYLVSVSHLFNNFVYITNFKIVLSLVFVVWKIYSFYFIKKFIKKFYLRRVFKKWPKRLSLVVVEYAFNPRTQRQKQVDLCNLEANLLYVVSSRTAVAVIVKLCLKKKLFVLLYYLYGHFHFGILGFFVGLLFCFLIQWCDLLFVYFHLFIFEEHFHISM